MTRITSLDATNTGYIRFTTEDGENVSAPVINSDAGCTIIDVEVGGRTVAMQVIDYGDGDAEVFECREGETYDGAADKDAYIVRRVRADDADSLEWVRNDPPR